MAKSIQEFYNDTETRDNVKNYLIDFLKEEGSKKMFAKEDVTGFADAREVIEKAFENMEYLFSPKPKEKKIINEAR